LLQQKYREAKKISDSALQISSQIQDTPTQISLASLLRCVLLFKQ